MAVIIAAELNSAAQFVIERDVIANCEGNASAEKLITVILLV